MVRNALFLAESGRMEMALTKLTILLEYCESDIFVLALNLNLIILSTQNQYKRSLFLFEFHWQKAQSVILGTNSEFMDNYDLILDTPLQNRRDLQKYQLFNTASKP